MSDPMGQFWDAVMEARNAANLLDATLDMYRYYQNQDDEYGKGKEFKAAETQLIELEQHVKEARRLFDEAR